MDERIRNFVGIAAIIALLSVAFGIVGFVRAYRSVAEPPGTRSFMISGEGRAVAVPDVAEFTFAVITEGGKDVAMLQKDNTSKTNAIIEDLKTRRIEARDIKTVSYQVEPRYTQQINCPAIGICPPPEITGYVVRQTLEVRARDTGKAGEYISATVAHGANAVSQLSFVVDDPAVVEARARASAMAQAKGKAEAVASAGGFRLGRILSVEEGYGPGEPVYVDALVPPAVEPGSQEIIQHVVLRYEIR